MPEKAFAAASLLEWLDVASKADVRSVPATVLEHIEIDALMEFDQGTHRSRIAMEALERANQARVDGNMLRWDCCAGLELKMGMAHDGRADDTDPRLDIDDPRAFDILYEFPHEEIAVVTRPWVQVRRHDGWPVEYRAFIVNGEVAGISNYYPQVSLPETHQVREEVHAVRRSSEAMLQVVVASGKLPWVSWPPGIPDQWQRQIQATLDFIVLEDGQVTFLEGGPGAGAGAGAHPCCYVDDTGKISPILGVALGKQARVNI